MQTLLVPILLNLPPGHADNRTAGMHLGRVISAIAEECGLLKTEDTTATRALMEAAGQSEAWWEGLEPHAQLRVAIGLAWEAWYLTTLSEWVLKHPGELCLEGVYMTPDGESLDLVLTQRGPAGHVLAVHEVKATYKSVNTVANPFDTQWMWTTQGMGYCKARGCRRLYLHVLFLCGDYKYPIRPSLGPHYDGHHCWRADFTQEEIDERWDVVSGYLHHRLAQQHEDEMRDTEDAR